MVGQVAKERVEDFGKILAPYFLEERTLFIVSSDFCHWGKRFKFTHKFEDCEMIHESIEKLDRKGMETIES
jgi:AmmeMemoRadiSam system protein B